MKFPLTLKEIIREQHIGNFDSQFYVEACIDRIKSLDGELGSVISINLDEPNYAIKGPLAGVPILVKDNIETRDELPTSAGSLALAKNVTFRDAPCVAKLRAGGIHILGKTNLSEWANFRSIHATSGWSAFGGQTHNPYRLGYSPCGSSSGSAVSVAVGMAPAAVGTETVGSIVCPASMSGVVGMKPTRGLVSAERIVPISRSLDTPGPIARTVTDAAILLSQMSGTYFHIVEIPISQLRLGVINPAPGYSDGIVVELLKLVGAVEQAGGSVVRDLIFDDIREINESGYYLMKHECRIDLDNYLSCLPNECRELTLEKIVKFNDDNQADELALFGQDIFTDILSSPTIDRDELLGTQRAAVDNSKCIIDRLLNENDVDVLVSLTNVPAWEIDYSLGDRPGFFGGVPGHPALAGYPHLTLPLGEMDDFPVGLSIIGGKGADELVLQVGVSLEEIIDFRPWQVFD